MKTADVDILIHPGLFGGSNSHWYARWAEKLATASQIEQDDWAAPDRESWISKLVATVDQAERPVVLIGHSLGVITIAHAAAQLTDKNVKGAFLAAPPDLEANLGEFAQTQTFLLIPMRHRGRQPSRNSRTDPSG